MRQNKFRRSYKTSLKYRTYYKQKYRDKRAKKLVWDLVLDNYRAVRTGYVGKKLVQTQVDIRDAIEGAYIDKTGKISDLGGKKIKSTQRKANREAEKSKKQYLKEAKQLTGRENEVYKYFAHTEKRRLNKTLIKFLEQPEIASRLSAETNIKIDVAKQFIKKYKYNVSVGTLSKHYHFYFTLTESQRDYYMKEQYPFMTAAERIDYIDRGKRGVKMLTKQTRERMLKREMKGENQ